MINLSIIVPVYKVEKFLIKCIDSILSQTYENFELILIDDGSPDNCHKICDEYAEKDKRVIVIHQKNLGVSAARNAGMDIAKGEYIGFIDSDDYIVPEMYEMMINRMEKNHCDLVICGYDYVDEQGNVNRAFEIKEDEVLSQREVMYKQYDILPTIRFGIWNKLFKRELIQNLRFPVGVHSAEDGVFLCEYLKKIKSALFIHQPYYKNCERIGSATRGGLDEYELINALKIHKQMAIDVKKVYPDVYPHAFSFYIDICLRYYSLVKDDKMLSLKVRKIVKKEKMNVLFCNDMSLKARISYLLRY